MNNVLLLLLLSATPDASSSKATPLAKQYEPKPGIGRAVAIIGDLDGDGCREIAIGDPSSYWGRCNKVPIFSGKTLECVRVLEPAQIENDFGGSIAACDDIDGDHVSDLAIGVNSLNASDKYPARVELYSGANGKLLRKIDGAGVHFGSFLEYVPDCDKDGIGELAIVSSDAVEVYSPVTTHKLLRIAVAAVGVRPIAILDDLDHDGLPDFGVCLKSAPTVYSSATGRAIIAFQVVNDFEPASCMCPLGDIDNDGVADVLVGVPQRVVKQTALSGIVTAYSGKTGNRLYEVPWRNPEEAMTRWGHDACRVGDINSDGIRDVAVARSGGPEGANVISGKDGSLLSEIKWKDTLDSPRIGWRVLESSDMDNDGHTDLALVRFNWGDPNRTGKVLYFFSSVTGACLGSLIKDKAP